MFRPERVLLLESVRRVKGLYRNGRGSYRAPGKSFNEGRAVVLLKILLCLFLVSSLGVMGHHGEPCLISRFSQLLVRSEDECWRAFVSIPVCQFAKSSDIVRLLLNGCVIPWILCVNRSWMSQFHGVISRGGMSVRVPMVHSWVCPLPWLFRQNCSFGAYSWL